MKNFFKSILAFLKSVLSDGGTGSYSRVASAAITFSAIGWISYLVLRTHALPDLGGPTMWVTGGVGTHYGLNKAPDIFAKFKNGNGNGQPPTNGQQQ